MHICFTDYNLKIKKNNWYVSLTVIIIIEINAYYFRQPKKKRPSKYGAVTWTPYSSFVVLILGCGTWEHFQPFKLSNFFLYLQLLTFLNRCSIDTTAWPHITNFKKTPGPQPQSQSPSDFLFSLWSNDEQMKPTTRLKKKKCMYIYRVITQNAKRICSLTRVWQDRQ